MRKIENVDILKTLYGFVRIRSKRYQRDFQNSIDTITKAAASNFERDKYLMFMLRDNGISCFREENVFMHYSNENFSWFQNLKTKNYIPATYTIKITGTQDDKVIGNIYELDKAHSGYILFHQAEAKEVRAEYERGIVVTPVMYYVDEEHIEYGKLIEERVMPRNPDKLHKALAEVHKMYDEAESVTLDELNSTLKAKAMYERLNSMDDEEKNSVIAGIEFSKLYGYTDDISPSELELYHAILEEHGEKEPMTEKPSIREQLAADKAKSTAAKATPTKKSKEDISLGRYVLK